MNFIILFKAVDINYFSLFADPINNVLSLSEKDRLNEKYLQETLRKNCEDSYFYTNFMLDAG